MDTGEKRTRSPKLLGAAAVAVAAIVAILTYVVFKPLVLGASSPPSVAQKLDLPDYDYAAWRGVPVEDGRVKPFESAATELVRQVCGKSKFGSSSDPPSLVGKRPVAIVLSWWMMGAMPPGDASDEWENYPFILCDHHGLRRELYAHAPAENSDRREEQLHGKYVSPADLRQSPGLERLLRDAQSKRRKDPEKANFLLTPEEAKAEEVAHRLQAYD